MLTDPIRTAFGSIGIVLPLSIFLVFSACSGRSIENQTNRTPIAANNRIPDKFQEADRLFKNWCQDCHGIHVAAFADRRWKLATSDTRMFAVIHDGWATGGMPAFGQTLDSSQIRSLISYIHWGEEQKQSYIDTESVETSFELDGMRLVLDTVATGFEYPWGLAFINDSILLVSDRIGKLYAINIHGGKQEIAGVPDVLSRPYSGLMDVALHPNFQSNQQLYLSYSKFYVPQPGDTLATLAILKARYAEAAIQDTAEVFLARPLKRNVTHYGGRLTFGPDDLLYFSVGDLDDYDMDLQSLDHDLAKVHRIHADGSIPESNPFLRAGKPSSVYTYGNRNIQGLEFNPVDQQLWSHEHGPKGGDELNKMEMGANYGWPLVTHGLDYSGERFSSHTERPGMLDPVLYWVPSIAPSGMHFISDHLFGSLRGGVLLGSLRFRCIVYLDLHGDKVLNQLLMFKGIGRVRTLVEGPDGCIYIAVEQPGYIFRVGPEKNS